MKKVQEQDNSPEALLRRLRQGYREKLMIKMGALEVPCRILSADDQVAVISNAKLKLKIPEGHDKEMLEANAVQKATLLAGCTVEGIPYLPKKLLDQLSADELGDLYDQYLTEIKYVNPEFEALNVEQISSMIEAVKKKTALPRKYFTWQLAAIGLYCLEHLQQKGKGAGL